MDNIEIFEDNITSNYFSVEYDDTKCLAKKCIVDGENCKLFVVLIKDAISKIKQRGCVVMEQYVIDDEWHAFLNYDKRWTLIELDKDTHVAHISCNIDDALGCIMTGLGINLP